MESGERIRLYGKSKILPIRISFLSKISSGTTDLGGYTPDSVFRVDRYKRWPWFFFEMYFSEDCTYIILRTFDTI